MLLPETKVYGGRLKDRAELLGSSSGGAFTALSNSFLVAGNAVIAATYSFSTHQQEYKLITTVDERNAARGSKYVQSIPGEIFKEAEAWLKVHPEKQLIFFGMGCQAAGFQSYAEAKGLRDRITVVDIICHGSPSPQIWKEYVGQLEKRVCGKVVSLTFKDKRKGWNHPTAIAKIGDTEIPLNRYVKIFYNRKELRLSCHKCPYTTTERTTDITIGDFWHIEEKVPEQYDEMGTSLLIIHTDKGVKLFEKAKNSLDWFESNTVDCWQLNLEKPTAMAEGREKFWQDYYAHGIDYIVEKYGSDSFMDKVKRKVKKLLGGGYSEGSIFNTSCEFLYELSCDWRYAA